MTGEPAPEVLAGAYPGRWFTELQVVRTGVRAGVTAKRPGGFPGAVCDCKCGRKGVLVPVYRLLNGNTTTCGHGKCTLPRGGSAAQRRIAAYLSEHGPARMTQIAADLGMTQGAAGGQLAKMLAAGLAARPFRGVYCLPGAAPADPPPQMPGRSRGNSKSGRTRWANMDEPGRQAVADRLAAGRAAAAGRRARERDESRHPLG